LGDNGCLSEQADGYFSSGFLGHHHFIQVNVEQRMRDKVSLDLASEGHPRFISLVDSQADQLVGPGSIQDSA
jgi:hypothetical protein